MSVAVAEGPLLLSECNGESSVLLDLNAMFPSLDHEVIVTVLQAHEGRVEAVVDYLMNVVGGGGEEVDEEEELQGPFSDDIGGPPEIVPSFLQEPAAEDNDIGGPPDILPSFLREPVAGDNDIGGQPEILPSFLQEPVAEDDDIGGPPEIVPSFLQETAADDRSLTESPDPLPTYEQACLPIEPGPPPYICVAHEASLPAPQSRMEPNPSHQRNREHCVHVPGQQETQISRERHLSREAQWPALNSNQGILYFPIVVFACLSCLSLTQCINPPSFPLPLHSS